MIPLNRRQHKKLEQRNFQTDGQQVVCCGLGHENEAGNIRTENTETVPVLVFHGSQVHHIVKSLKYPMVFTAHHRLYKPKAVQQSNVISLPFPQNTKQEPGCQSFPVRTGFSYEIPFIQISRKVTQWHKEKKNDINLVYGKISNLSENWKTLLSQSTCSSAKIYRRIFKHNMLTSPGRSSRKKVGRKENRGGSSTVKPIQRRQITGTATRRYNKKKNVVPS